MSKASSVFRNYNKTTIVGLLIVILCLIPSSQLNKLGVKITFQDLIIHFVMFFTFSAALFYDNSKGCDISAKMKNVIITTVIISLILGGSTELLQEFIIPLKRTGSLSDLLFDLLGSIAGAYSCMLFIKRKSCPEH